MSTGTRIPLARAQAAAAYLIDLWALEGAHVVGSVRRQRAEVGDLEMVCYLMPAEADTVYRNIKATMSTAGTTSLFDVPREKVVVCPFSSTKSLYAESGRVLVDDFRRNCEEWVAKGGTAILVKPGEPDVPRIIALLTQIAENQFPDDPHIYEV